MKISFSKEKCKKKFFDFIFILWFSTEIIFRSKYVDLINNIFPNIEKYINYIVLILLITQIVFFQKYTRKELYVIIPVSILIIVSAITSGINYLLSAWLFILGTKNTDIDKVIRSAYRILFVLIPIIILGNIVGIIPEVIQYRGSVVRHSLGFLHPNSLGLSLFQFMLCYCYIKWEKIKWYNLLVIIGGAIFSKIVADSKTATYSMVLLVLFILIFKILAYFKQNIKMVFSRVLQSISLIIGAGNIILSKIDVRNYVILQEIDMFLSQRFSMCHRVFKIFGETWLGNKLYISEKEREMVGIRTVLYLDSAYCNLWLRFGIIILILFLVAYFLLYNKVDHSPVIVMILFIYSVYGVMEAGLIQMRNNVFLLMFSYLIYSGTTQKEQM